MATQYQKINPLDRQPRKAVGIDVLLSGTSVFNSTFTTRDAIKNNIVNYVLTNNNERPLNPDFGAGLLGLLFENINESQLEAVKEILTDKLNINFPNIIIRELNLISEPDTNAINFQLKYAIRDTGMVDEEINVQIET